MKINHLIVSAIACASLFSTACSQKADNTVPQAITTEVPPRPEGATDLIGFAAEPIDTVRVGIIGLGMRGYSAVDRLNKVPGARIVAICDLDTASVERAQKIFDRNGQPRVDSYGGSEDAWQQLTDRDDLDLVYVVTDWKHHYPMAKRAMEQGKHVAIEVPAAMDLDEIWGLIDTAEKTKRHCMMLENCVYDFFEMNTLNMAQQGLFGDVLHTEGSYIHNLSDFWDEYANDWRMQYNIENRGDVYPTHGMGPACQLLDIHRGDRMTTLVAMDTKAASGPEFLVKDRGANPDSVKYANGDHTMTMIRTANGKTIHIQHDVVNPRPYSRMYQLTGTKGFANKYPYEGYAFMPEALDSASTPDYQNLSSHNFVSEEQMKSLNEKYMHPIIREVGEVAKKVGGHGGMDYIMDYRLIYCLNNGLPLDMDVYDLAEWCSLAPLTKLSIENGSAPVEVPDFTRGAWQKQKGFRHAYK